MVPPTQISPDILVYQVVFGLVQLVEKVRIDEKGVFQLRALFLRQVAQQKALKRFWVVGVWFHWSAYPSTICGRVINSITQLNSGARTVCNTPFQLGPDS